MFSSRDQSVDKESGSVCGDCSTRGELLRTDQRPRYERHYSLFYRRNSLFRPVKFSDKKMW